MVSKDKAYIVANEQQEREVLEKLELEGMKWSIINEKPTDFAPSIYNIAPFPYVIIVNNWISWNWLSNLKNEEIIYDGRKREEEQMSEKYGVSQEFMNELKKWKDGLELNGKHSVYDFDIQDLSDIINDWWCPIGIRDYEQNNRLIAILRWVNGEDVFEIEKPKKWVVHELNTELYVTTYDGHTGITPNQDYITKFDTKEEAQSWANSHQEVIEVEG